MLGGIQLITERKRKEGRTFKDFLNELKVFECNQDFSPANSDQLALDSEEMDPEDWDKDCDSDTSSLEDAEPDI